LDSKGIGSSIKVEAGNESRSKVKTIDEDVEVESVALVPEQ
jgi:hypothetical protein